MKRFLATLCFIVLCLTAMAQAAITHIVKQGETISGIAKQYNVPLEVLLQANPNMRDYFYVGMELNIPVKVKNDIQSTKTEVTTSNKTEAITTFTNNQSTGQLDYSYSSDTTEETEKLPKNLKTIGLMLWAFDDGYDAVENYGIFTEALTNNGFGAEFAIRTRFKEYANYNMELGLNYTLGVLRDENMALMLIASWAPLSIRTQKTYDVELKGYKSGFYLDTYFSVRTSFKVLKVAVSLGYFYWMPKWCIDEGAKGINGLSLGLHYVY